MSLERQIKRDIDDIVRKIPQLADFLSQLGRQGRVVVFGGFVRDCIHNHFHGQSISPRDLDLVIDGTIPPGEEGPKNNFGGRRRLLGRELKIDFWELRSTYAFSKGLFTPTLANLPLTTVYGVNACFFALDDARLVESGAVDDIAKRVISFNCTDYLEKFPQYQAFRGIELAHRLGYGLHERVLNFAKSQIRESPREVFVRAIQDHRPNMTAEEIGRLCDPYR